MSAIELAKPIVKKWESLELEAYPDPATGGAPWTIGWGRAHGVNLGDRITSSTAEMYLDEDLAEAQRIVDDAVEVTLTDEQRAALISFVFNVGHGRADEGGRRGKDGFVILRNGRPSTMLRKLNEADYEGCAAEFPKWNRGAGKVMRGLTLRRADERALFESLD